MMMALHGLLKAGLVEGIYSSTYQAASGAGAKHMNELLTQMSRIGREVVSAKMAAPGGLLTALELEAKAMAELRSGDFPVDNFGAPLALSLIPWIDSGLLDGRTKEEWKMGFETRKILGLSEDDRSIVADSLCVRVGALRCHSQSLLVKLRTKADIAGIEEILSAANPWVKVVRNEKSETLAKLTPAYVSGKLDVVIGRLHYSDEMGGNILKAFTVGDQLLWGAAEPIRRVLRIVLGEAV
jgi:aspartate-semialdehyde dehydrogenase